MNPGHLVPEVSRSATISARTSLRGLPFPVPGLDVCPLPHLTRSHGLIPVVTAVTWFCDRKIAVGVRISSGDLMLGIAPGAK